ncbi:hypothetical protein CANCADRAFT_45988 [Tortispora caseinolytica NRRL Y-17796]|uniref:Uncharacterized protein n=1 Tax=Tortispora caseinolytica NRRL Y-17796 TaxID=767744 RepID=A0A1E4TCT5_9ASCO|nr:hypothetical protein CANCADRAFT_45988 [Tortispora caseinolytica NRRL Y-17796]
MPASKPKKSGPSKPLTDGKDSPDQKRRSSRRTAPRVNYSEDQPVTEQDPGSTTKRSSPPTASNGRSKRLKRDHDALSDNESSATPPYISTVNHEIETIIDLTDATIRDDSLFLADGSVYSPGDHIYLVCEPPGEPYYISRLMEFVLKDDIRSASPTAKQKADPKNYKVRVNWFYRPRDISKPASDSRMLIVTMHSDVCPIQSIRGHCTVKHKTFIEDMHEYRQKSNHFWFDQLYDRYIQRFYEMVPVSSLLNLPEFVRTKLQQRVTYVALENTRAKELCSAPNSCTRCHQWCSVDESVECATCGRYYHMQCLRPPLLKKPTRGFGWACASCSRQQERKAREYNGAATDDLDELDLLEAKNDAENPPAPFKSSLELAFENIDDLPETPEQKRQRKLWPYRYLGINCRIEDVLDRDDHIYPRAVSRIGARFQCDTPEWHGAPVKYIGPSPSQKSAGNNKKNAGAASQAKFEPHLAKLEEGEFWIERPPSGYVERGGDQTSTLLWKNPENLPATIADDFLQNMAVYAKKLKMSPRTPNFIDACLSALLNSDYDPTEAEKKVKKFTRRYLKEPTLSAAEVQQFEDAVREFGSELYNVSQKVPTKKTWEIVRFYYIWKKTKNGEEIWGKYPGRKGGNNPKFKSTVKTIEEELVDSGDDSAYDNEKVKLNKKPIRCLFCNTQSSGIWRRAPGSNNRNDSSVSALCLRCARLWRRYAVKWEPPEEIERKFLLKNGQPQKRLIEQELLDDYRINLGKTSSQDVSVEPREPSDAKAKPKAKSKEPKEADVVKEESPAVKIPTVFCDICDGSVTASSRSVCDTCGIIVHNDCYGIMENDISEVWRCQPCTDSVKNERSMFHDCVLCPTHMKRVKGPLKGTLGSNWVHARCAIFVPEVTFTHSDSTEIAAGIIQVPSSRFKKTCQICSTSGGACVACTDCSVHVHVQCAAKSNSYKLALEFQPVKASRRATTPTIEMGGKIGMITASVWCPAHKPKKGQFIPLHSEVGKNKNIFRKFCETYKRTDDNLKGTARLAHELNVALRRTKPARNPTHSRYSGVTDNQRCSVCGRGSTPIWWPSVDSGVLCHNCYRQTAERSDI